LENSVEQSQRINELSVSGRLLGRHV
jgi:hypothetical protein